MCVCVCVCVCATRAGAAHTINRSGVKEGTLLKDREDPLGRRGGTDESKQQCG